jgi:hypothetical protein
MHPNRIHRNRPRHHPRHRRTQIRLTKTNIRNLDRHPTPPDAAAPIHSQQPDSKRVEPICSETTQTQPPNPATDPTPHPKRERFGHGSGCAKLAQVELGTCEIHGEVEQTHVVVLRVTDRQIAARTENPPNLPRVMAMINLGAFCSKGSSTPRAPSRLRNQQIAIRLRRESIPCIKADAPLAPLTTGGRTAASKHAQANTTDPLLLCRLRPLAKLAIPFRKPTRPTTQRLSNNLAPAIRTRTDDSSIPHTHVLAHVRSAARPAVRISTGPGLFAAAAT